MPLITGLKYYVETVKNEADCEWTAKANVIPAIVIAELSCGCTLRWRGVWSKKDRAFIPQTARRDGMPSAVPEVIQKALAAGLGGSTNLCCASFLDPKEFAATSNAGWADEARAGGMGGRPKCGDTYGPGA